MKTIRLIGDVLTAVVLFAAMFVILYADIIVI